MTRHFPVARVSAVVALAVGAFLVTQRAGGTHWRNVGPGVEFTTLRGEPWCRHGSAAIAVLRVDPARAQLHVRSYLREPERLPQDIVTWSRRTGALAVFNAGQYYTDYSYMGLLACGGEVLSRRRHPTFQAALVAGPKGGGAAARVLDLAREPLDPDSLGWEDVAQSFMLFDRTGGLRVRHSDQVAARTAVGEDGQGRIVVLVTEGGYTLWDFGTWLKDAPLGLRQAMAMDGGLEAQLLVNSGRFHFASWGQWDHARGADGAPAPPVPLPVVVTVGAP